MPYLAALGISHVYCSPVLEATPGSTHGYDVVDHARLSSDLGGDEGWADLVAACRQHGLGIVVDVVPNHMGLPVPEDLNGAYWDLLANGRQSAYSPWFDVDWELGDGKLLVPVLGDDLASCLEKGEVVVDATAGVVRYFDHLFPLSGEPTGDAAAVLARQHYRLAHWRTASTELNYRRFFDVTTLAGVRVEVPEVFERTHERLLTAVRAGEIDGLRIDHPDGLADPGGYLDRLAADSGVGWTVVEKILEPGEHLPGAWQCAGTTGYDAITAITHLLLDPAGEPAMTELYAELTGSGEDFETVVTASKRQVLGELFGSEVQRLLRELAPVRGESDFDDASLRRALVELLVAFDVYRAYVDDPASKQRIDAAVEHATQRAPDLTDELRWLSRLLHHDEPAAKSFAIRFEQTTGPVMAKGVEDTAFYRYFRLSALNEVGGNPGGFGLSVDRWHADCERRVRDWPASMTTLSTHDTKRSEDVRARLLVLAEVPDQWRSAVTRWRDRAARHGPPDANTDYLFWQTMAGAWPIDAQRLKEYLRKAVREAKQHTSWLDPDESYESALDAYVDAVLADSAIADDVARWVDEVVRQPGDSNTLAQKLVQLTMPGVPDVYQGQELEERTLVDPDNRRPVDYDERRRLLSVAPDEQPVKLHLAATALRLRREQPEAFAGDYTPLTVRGAAAAHAVAFARGNSVVTIATRLPVGLARGGGWCDTTVELPPGDWRDLLTGRQSTGGLATVLADLPVALLVRAGRGSA